MHAAFFSLKRLHWSAYKWSRNLSSVVLPPSRADMLRVIGMYEEKGSPVTQTFLAERLGIHPSVVSRTLKRSEQLGLVRRAHWEKDRRYKLICLTNIGKRLVKNAIDDDGASDEMAAITCLPVHQGRLGFDFSPVYERFNHARRMLGDTSPFLHPWRVAESAGLSIRRYDVEDRVDGCEYRDGGRIAVFEAKQPAARVDKTPDSEWPAFRDRVTRERRADAKWRSSSDAHAWQ